MENQYNKNATTPYHFDEGDDGSLASLGILRFKTFSTNNK